MSKIKDDSLFKTFELLLPTRKPIMTMSYPHTMIHNNFCDYRIMFIIFSKLALPSNLAILSTIMHAIKRGKHPLPTPCCMNMQLPFQGFLWDLSYISIMGTPSSRCKGQKIKSWLNG
jgi:hypothetical protein